MKKILMAVLMAAAVFVSFNAWAADTDEGRADKESTEIDERASKPNGEKPVVDRIEKEFHVTDAQINDMRAKNLGYGEITIALALAQKLPGGATQANIDKILAMRQGPPKEGWGEIAKKLGFKLGPVVSHEEKMNRREEGKEMRRERHEGKKGERMEEKREKMERPEKNERPDRPERPERGRY